MSETFKDQAISPMLARTAIYLDSNAGTPLCSAAREALLLVLGEKCVFIPNPSSIHAYGRSAKRVVAEARELVATSLGPQIDPEQIVFTSSGTEANQLAVRSILEPKLDRGEKPHWITTAVEHDSNRQMVSWLEKRGGTVSFIPLDATGVPEVEAFDSLVRPETVLVSSLWVNNETGAISDVGALAKKARQYSLPLHLDAAQAWGKLLFNLEEIEAQFVTFSGHKIGALVGTGVLLLGRGCTLHAVIPGKQEKGRRGGTENLLGIMSLGAAAGSLNPGPWVSQVEPLRDQLQKTICERIPGTWVNAMHAPRIGNTLNLNFEGVEGEGLVMALDLAGYAVSSGSACASGVLEPSHVLLAMGRTHAQAMAALRISLPGEMPWKVLNEFVTALEKAVARIRVVSRKNILKEG